ncbi:MAG: T9SS type A sorting domain-containing protein [Crocinitomicaceae bacterium]|nr:T9SS type A sorting domain-containing protein [Crocinitomicaceae bacterium]
MKINFISSKVKNITLGIVLGGLFCAPTALSQGWKHDITFKDAGINSRQIYTGAIDSDDKTYLLEREPVSGGSGYRLVLGQYNDDGTQGYSHYLGMSNGNVIPTGHAGGGVAVDEDYVYVSYEYQPINGNVGGARIMRIDKNTPANWVAGFNDILGWCQVTDLAVYGDYLYVYGYLGGGFTHDVQFFTSTGSQIISPYGGYRNTGFLARYNRTTLAMDWVKRVSNNGAMTTTDMEIDGQGNIYLASSSTDGTTIGTSSAYTFNYNTIAEAGGVVVRYTPNGNFDPTFAPIVRAIPNPTNSFHKDFVDDIKADPITDHIYITSSNNIIKYNASNSATVWQRNIPTMKLARLAVGSCSEMYVTGTKVAQQGPLTDERYFAQSLNKNTGVLTTSLQSAPHNQMKNSDGEIIFIQSDGDKVIAADYKGANSIAIDYNHVFFNPTGTVTYSPYSVSGSFIGIFDDGVKGTLVSDFILTDNQGNEKYNFLCGEDIIFDGTTSLNETNHFIDLWRRPAGTSGSFQYYGGFGWQGGQADVKNFSQMATANGYQLQPNYEYRIKLAVQNECVGWLEKLVDFTIEAIVMDASFSSLNTNTNGTTYDIVATSANNPAGVMHLWWLWDPAAGSIVAMSGWTTSGTYTFSGLTSGTLFTLVHIVSDPSGCAANQNAAHYVGQKSTGISEGTEEFSEEMLAILADINAGRYGYLKNGIESDDSYDIQLYPNPSREKTTLMNGSNFEANVSIKNLNGKIVANYELSALGKVIMDVHSLSSGVYLVDIQFEDGTATMKRLMKE